MLSSSVQDVKLGTRRPDRRRPSARVPTYPDFLIRNHRRVDGVRSGMSCDIRVHSQTSQDHGAAHLSKAFSNPSHNMLRVHVTDVVDFPRHPSAGGSRLRVGHMLKYSCLTATAFCQGTELAWRQVSEPKITRLQMVSDPSNKISRLFVSGTSCALGIQIRDQQAKCPWCDLV